MTRQRKKFSRKQKVEAVRQIEDGEKTLSEVSHDLGVAASTVSAWRKEWRELGTKAFPGKGRGDEKDRELARLRRENASLKEDNVKGVEPHFKSAVRPLPPCRLIDKLRASGAEAVILGCTEIALLVSQDDTSVPLYDTTALHAAQAVQFAL